MLRIRPVVHHLTPTPFIRSSAPTCPPLPILSLPSPLPLSHARLTCASRLLPLSACVRVCRLVCRLLPLVFHRSLHLLVRSRSISPVESIGAVCPRTTEEVCEEHTERTRDTTRPPVLYTTRCGVVVLPLPTRCTVRLFGPPSTHAFGRRLDSMYHIVASLYG